MGRLQRNGLPSRSGNHTDAHLSVRVAGSDVPDPPSRNTVRRTYDRIAEHFACTRSTGWPEIATFLDGRQANRACDLGCGNGRHFTELREVSDVVVGVDFSRRLLEMAVDRANGGIHRVQGDVVTLPFLAGTFDIGLLVATLHHVPTRAARVRALDEFARVLDGDGLISVWSVTAERFTFAESRDHAVPWTLPNGEVIDRYYHLFDESDFRSEIAESELVLAELRESSENWYARVRA